MTDGRRPRRLDLLREVLDHEVVDVDGVSCGVVDDIELRRGEHGPVVAFLQLGPGAWAPRLPALAEFVAKALFGRAKVRVPWEDVVGIDETIRLRRKAAELGLGGLDRRAGRWLSKLPGSG
jgi:sporulation protein YlmC with PRC-barrel domain